MIRYAMIRNGAVENVVLWDGVSEWTPDDDFDVIDCPPEVGPGWRHGADGFVSPEEPGREPDEP